MLELNLARIEKMIYVVRGLRIMLDSDLAELYGVETGRLNEQVKRNIERFPEDFMFQLTSEEHDALRSQIAISKKGKGGRRYQPLVFTENGVAMLSSVLNSPNAIQVNISIMRIFNKLRSFLALGNAPDKRLSDLEKNNTKLFRVVFERLDAIEEVIAPRLSPNRKKIGLRK